MQATSLRLAALAVPAAIVAVAAALLLAPPARSQINTTPTLSPIGVSAAGGESTVWFHEPSSRLAVACQTVSTSGRLGAIQCVSTRLP
jgi:hypothetical protein